MGASTNTERGKEMKHEHKYIYSDVPAIGECACGALRIFDRFTQEYKIVEGER